MPSISTDINVTERDSLARSVGHARGSLELSDSLGPWVSFPMSGIGYNLLLTKCDACVQAAEEQLFPLPFNELERKSDFFFEDNKGALSSPFHLCLVIAASLFFSFFLLCLKFNYAY